MGAVSGPHAPNRTRTRTRSPRRLALEAVGLLLGVLLLVLGAVGLRSDAEPAARPEPVAEDVLRFRADRQVWHSAPADRLFPPTIAIRDGGPGGTDRRWIRLGIAPDTPDCTRSLPSALRRDLGLDRLGCHRMLRATYTDSTGSQVVTLGVAVLQAEPAAMRAAAAAWESRSARAPAPGSRPRPFAVPGSPAASFTAASVAAWTLRMAADAPFLTWSAAGFADGRTVRSPIPAAASVSPSPRLAAVESGLTEAARTLAARLSARWLTEADRLWRAARPKASATSTPTPSTTTIRSRHTPTRTQGQTR
jgi:hypothetical protein